MHEFLSSDTSQRLKLEEAASSQDLPPAYYTHPAVVEHGVGQVRPLGLFVDGLPYSKVDSAIGVWIIDIVSGTRFLVAVIRKALICTCGCRGWCTLWEVFSWLSWSMLALLKRSCPTARRDGKPWKASDAWRSDQAGAPIAGRCHLLFIKGDWA